MAYPAMTDYQDVLQEPSKAFADPVLRQASVATSPLGLPLPMSGGFAITYRLRSDGASYAVRCFHREIPGVTQRYGMISNALSRLSSNYFATFDFQPTGILVNGARYPIVKMDWMQGETLDAYLERYANDRARMSDLRAKFGILQTWLEAQGIAHGDLQNGNVIVGPGGLKLIDYDGMFVPGMSAGSGTEVGHKHFQHPGRTEKDFGPRMDRFSFIALDLSLEALAADPSLHRRFREGGEAIVFKANDFADPEGSDVFRSLRAMSALRERVDRFAAICTAPIQAIPTVADYQAGRNIPATRVRTTAEATAPPPPKRYIGAYPVLAGSDYAGVLRRVGDRIEIVGQVVSVKQGVGRRGRGRNRPYVFINFGIWNQKSVKVTIWSEGLSAMTARPDQSWVGRWLSVTGLVEPPYEGAHYGKAYFSVGVTLTSDSQLVQLSAADAQFRLSPAGSGVTPPKQAAGTNADLVGSLRQSNPSSKPATPSRPAPTPRPTPSATPPMSANAALVATLKTGGSTSTPSRTGAPPRPSVQVNAPAPSATSTSSWGWLGWVVTIGGLLFFLSQCGGWNGSEVSSVSEAPAADLNAPAAAAPVIPAPVEPTVPLALPDPKPAVISAAFDQLMRDFNADGMQGLIQASTLCHAELVAAPSTEKLDYCLAIDDFANALAAGQDQGQLPTGYFANTEQRQRSSVELVLKGAQAPDERIAAVRRLAVALVSANEPSLSAPVAEEETSTGEDAPITVPEEASADVAPG